MRCDGIGSRKARLEDQRRVATGVSFQASSRVLTLAVTCDYGVD